MIQFISNIIIIYKEIQITTYYYINFQMVLLTLPNCFADITALQLTGFHFVDIIILLLLLNDNISFLLISN